MRKIEYMTETSQEEEKKAEIFESQQEMMGEIYQYGFSEYIKNNLDKNQLKDAFDSNTHKAYGKYCMCVGCMDERLEEKAQKHSAGSGVLLSEKERKEYFDEVKPDAISWHKGCGAVALYCKQNGISEDIDAYAQKYAEVQAAKLDVDCIEIKINNPEFHYARVCYYDGIGNFNFKGNSKWPEGFIVGRKDMGKDRSIEECKVAKDIIFGHHGFGPELLTKENPFLYVAIAKTQEDLKILKDELSQTVNSLGEEFDGKIKIDGFVALQNKK